MARESRWNKDQRKKLYKMVNDGVTEQEIREALTHKGKPQMSSVEFAQQLKMAMVEAGAIKQAKKKKKEEAASSYEVTSTGRLTIKDFTDLTGYKTGAKFKLEKPRGKSNAWRVVPVD